MPALHRDPRLLSFAFLFALAACDGAPPEEPDAGRCTPGSAGCACLAESRCEGSLVCDMGLCRAASTRELVVRDARARSCEVVLVEGGTEVLGVEFGSGVRGTFIREAPRTALTFFRESDAAFATGAVRVLNTEALGSINLRRARCFDRDGVELGEVLGLEDGS